jgi:ABC-type antimicrobial peptide transport system permease subunit
VLAYSVSLRQQEFGIRIALGSGKAALVRLVVRQASYPVIGGVLVGLGGAFVATRSLQSLLYQTQTTDPAAIAASMLLLIAMAALAVIVPAQHAATVDPMEVLRKE